MELTNNLWQKADLFLSWPVGEQNSLLGDENVLNLDCDGSYVGKFITTTHQKTFNWLIFNCQLSQ